MKIIFVEGMPGCGKSTLSDNLSAMLRDKGCESCSYQELDKNHPISLFGEMKNGAHSIQYLEKNLSGWEIFVKSNSHKNDVHIFDAAPLQNSVRFAIEADYAERGSKYIKEMEKILTDVSSRLIYLRPDCPLQQTDFCVSDKGFVWGSKVSGYLQETDISKRQGWEGIAGMRQFWDYYVSICDVLVEEVEMPKRIIRAVPGEWCRVQEEAFRFVYEETAL